MGWPPRGGTIELSPAPLVPMAFPMARFIDSSTDWGPVAGSVVDLYTVAFCPFGRDTYPPSAWGIWVFHSKYFQLVWWFGYCLDFLRWRSKYSWQSNGSHIYSFEIFVHLFWMRYRRWLWLVVVVVVVVVVGNNKQYEPGQTICNGKKEKKIQMNIK